MKSYRIVFSKQAKKDIDELTPKQKAKLQDIQHFVQLTVTIIERRNKIKI